MTSETRRAVLKGLAVAASTVPTGAKAQPAPAPTSCFAEPSKGRFGLDLLGQRICNSWDEINSWREVTKKDFDVIIIGAGMFGAYLADKLYRKPAAPSKELSILVIDQGSYVFATHYQNLGRSVTGSIQAFPDMSTGDSLCDARDVVWNTPWAAADRDPMQLQAKKVSLTLTAVWHIALVGDPFSGAAGRLDLLQPISSIGQMMCGLFWYKTPIKAMQGWPTK